MSNPRAASDAPHEGGRIPEDGDGKAPDGERPGIPEEDDGMGPGPHVPARSRADGDAAAEAQYELSDWNQPDLHVALARYARDETWLDSVPAELEFRRAWGGIRATHPSVSVLYANEDKVYHLWQRAEGAALHKSLEESGARNFAGIESAAKAAAAGFKGVGPTPAWNKNKEMYTNLTTSDTRAQALIDKNDKLVKGAFKRIDMLEKKVRLANKRLKASNEKAHRFKVERDRVIGCLVRYRGRVGQMMTVLIDREEGAASKVKSWQGLYYDSRRSHRLSESWEKRLMSSKLREAMGEAAYDELGDAEYRLGHETEHLMAPDLGGLEALWVGENHEERVGLVDGVETRAWIIPEPKRQLLAQEKVRWYSDGLKRMELEAQERRENAIRQTTGPGATGEAGSKWREQRLMNNKWITDDVKDRWARDCMSWYTGATAMKLETKQDKAMMVLHSWEIDHELTKKSSLWHTRRKELAEVILNAIGSANTEVRRNWSEWLGDFTDAMRADEKAQEAANEEGASAASVVGAMAESKRANVKDFNVKGGKKMSELYKGDPENFGRRLDVFFSWFAKHYGAHSPKEWYRERCKQIKPRNQTPGEHLKIWYNLWKQKVLWEGGDSGSYDLDESKEVYLSTIKPPSAACGMWLVQVQVCFDEGERVRDLIGHCDGRLEYLAKQLPAQRSWSNNKNKSFPGRRYYSGVAQANATTSYNSPSSTAGTDWRMPRGKGGGKKGGGSQQMTPDQKTVLITHNLCFRCKGSRKDAYHRDLMARKQPCTKPFGKWKPWHHQQAAKVRDMGWRRYRETHGNKGQANSTYGARAGAGSSAGAGSGAGAGSADAVAATRALAERVGMNSGAYKRDRSGYYSVSSCNHIWGVRDNDDAASDAAEPGAGAAVHSSGAHRTPKILNGKQAAGVLREQAVLPHDSVYVRLGYGNESYLFPAFVDNGANVNLISRRAVSKLLEQSRKAGHAEMRTAEILNERWTINHGGNKMRSTQLLHIVVKVGRKMVPTTFHIVDTVPMNAPLLLSNQFLVRWHAYTRVNVRAGDDGAREVGHQSYQFHWVGKKGKGSHSLLVYPVPQGGFGEDAYSGAGPPEPNAQAAQLSQAEMPAGVVTPATALARQRDLDGAEARAREASRQIQEVRGSHAASGVPLAMEGAAVSVDGRTEQQLRAARQNVVAFNERQVRGLQREPYDAYWRGPIGAGESKHGESEVHSACATPRRDTGSKERLQWTDVPRGELQAMYISGERAPVTRHWARDGEECCDPESSDDEFITEWQQEPRMTEAGALDAEHDGGKDEAASRMRRTTASINTDTNEEMGSAYSINRKMPRTADLLDGDYTGNPNSKANRFLRAVQRLERRAHEAELNQVAKVFIAANDGQFERWDKIIEHGIREGATLDDKMQARAAEMQRRRLLGNINSVSVEQAEADAKAERSGPHLERVYDKELAARAMAELKSFGVVVEKGSKKRGELKGERAKDAGEGYLETIPGAPKWNHKQNKLFGEKGAALDKAVAEMLEAGQIEPSQSDYNIRVVMVEKTDKDGRKYAYRFCIDCRDPNKWTIQIRRPLPDIEAASQHLGGKRIFSALDMMGGYYQLVVPKKYRHMLAFTQYTETAHKKWQFKRGVMGAINSDPCFSTAVLKIFEGCEKYGWRIFKDDVTGAHNLPPELMEGITFLGQRAAEGGVMFKEDKILLAMAILRAFGFIYDKDGRRPDRAKVEALLSMPEPVCKRDIGVFYGLANYYRRHIEDLAIIAKPLNDLRKKDVRFVWGEAEQAAFDHIKRLLCTYPCLRRFDPRRAVIVDTDASPVGIGGTLAQVFDDGEHPIAYWSRAIKPSEMHYSTTEKELLAVKEATMDTWREFLVMDYEVRTDANNVRWLFSNPIVARQSAGRLRRWLLVLQGEDKRMTLVHRLGCRHANADAMSRLVRQRREEYGPLAKSELAARGLDVVEFGHDFPFRVKEWDGKRATLPGKQFRHEGDLLAMGLEIDLRPPGSPPKGRANPSYDDPIEVHEMEASWTGTKRGRGVDSDEERDAEAAPSVKRVPVKRKSWLRKYHGDERERKLARWVHFDQLTRAEDGTTMPLRKPDTRNTRRSAETAPCYTVLAHMSACLEEDTAAGVDDFHRFLLEQEALEAEMNAVLGSGEEHSAAVHATTRSGRRTGTDPDTRSGPFVRRATRFGTVRGRATVNIPPRPRVEAPSYLEIAKEQATMPEFRNRIARVKEAGEYEMPENPGVWYTYQAVAEKPGCSRCRMSKNGCDRCRVEHDMLLGIVKHPQGGETIRRLMLPPPSMRRRYMALAHDVPLAGHQGRERTLERAREIAWWPMMAKDVTEYVKTCEACQRRRTPVVRGVRRAFPAAAPMQIVHVDFVGPIVPGPDGECYILVMIDRFSRMMKAEATKLNDAATAARVFVDRWICSFGTPSAILTDRGSHFLNALWDHLLDWLWIRRKTTASYHPQTNGMVERRNRDLKNMLSKLCTDHHERWPSLLQQAVFAMNTSVVSTTGFTPYEALWGRNPRLVFSDPLFCEMHSERLNSPVDYGKSVAVHLSKCWKTIAENERQGNAESLRTGGTQRLAKLTVGDRVWKRNRIKGSPTKMIGPCVVVEDTSGHGRSFKVRDLATSRVYDANVNDLEQFLRPPQYGNRYGQIVDADQSHDMWCTVCGDGGDDLLMCNACPKVYHVTCLRGSQSRSGGDDNWVCPTCLSRRSPEESVVERGEEEAARALERSRARVAEPRVVAGSGPQRRPSARAAARRARAQAGAGSA